MPMPFDDVPYVLHNASNISQPEVPRHLFLSSPGGLYASITNDSPTFMFKIQWGKTHECLVFKGILVPRDGAHLTWNAKKLAIIQTPGYRPERISSGTECHSSALFECSPAIGL
jgi:hypothetical protein